MRFTLPARDRAAYLTARYSERKEAVAKEAQRLAGTAMSQEVKDAAG